MSAPLRDPRARALRDAQREDGARRDRVFGDATVAVIDPDHAGKRVRDVVPYLRATRRSSRRGDEALRFEPNALLVGVAPPGGALPPRGARRSLALERDSKS
jgi:uncharacterized NAD-dependent epimerase/dehydratase family protein